MVEFSLMLGGFGIVGLAILIWFKTPSGKKWLESL